MYGIEGRQSALLFVGKDNVFNEYPPNPVGFFGGFSLQITAMGGLYGKWPLHSGNQMVVRAERRFSSSVEVRRVESLPR